MNTDLLRESAAKVRARLPATRPSCAVVLGSGWGGIAESFGIKSEIAYDSIPCLGGTGVPGHAGRLVLAQSGERHIVMFLGRRHWYEGAGWEPVAFPVFLAVELRVSALILTNASGGIREDLRAGDLMALDDHINCMGVNPLVGPHDSVWGERFPDMTRVYDAGMIGLLDESAARAGIRLTHGVYAAVSGPNYETPAEVLALKALGADAVGMSTVPEAILAHAAGLRVAGVSCVANRAASRSGPSLSHDEVIAAVKGAEPRMHALLADVVLRL